MLGIKWIKTKVAEYRMEQGFAKQLEALQSMDHGKLGDPHIRLDIVGLVWDSGVTDVPGPQTSYQTRVWWENNQWKELEKVLLHDPEILGQPIEFEAYKIADVSGAVLYLLPTGEFVLTHRKTYYTIQKREFFVLRYSNLEDLSKAIVESKLFDDCLYMIFRWIGKRSLLCRPLPEEKTSCYVLEPELEGTLPKGHEGERVPPVIV